MDHLAEAKRIIAEVLYLTLATVFEDGQPWNTPVYAVADDRYHFYWTSSPTAQHSRNIAVNHNVFAVVYDTRQTERTGTGVYMRGQAEELQEPAEINRALRAFYRRKNRPSRAVQDFLWPLTA